MRESGPNGVLVEVEQRLRFDRDGDRQHGHGCGLRLFGLREFLLGEDFRFADGFFRSTAGIVIAVDVVRDDVVILGRALVLLIDTDSGQ